MLRLLLGLLVACALVYGSLRLLGRHDQQQATRRTTVDGVDIPAAGGPGAARAIINDYQKIESANRAVLDRTVRSAETP